MTASAARRGEEREEEVGDLRLGCDLISRALVKFCASKCFRCPCVAMIKRRKQEEHDM